MQLIYWPQIPGRGEFVRFVLEDLALDYVDVAREHGAGAVMTALRSNEGPPMLAPPILKVGARRIFQTPNICLFLGMEHGMVPATLVPEVLQQQLCVLDLATEAHDTHHPTSTALTYEQQQEAALPRAKSFLQARLPKFLDYAERVLESNGGDWMVGKGCTPADLGWVHALRGLRYAFPRAMARVEADVPRLVALHDRVVERPSLAAYLGSDRCLAFNEHGLFRHYQELDLPR